MKSRDYTRSKDHALSVLQEVRPLGRIVPLSFRSTGAENVEFDRQFIFNLDGSARDANRSNTEVVLA